MRSAPSSRARSHHALAVDRAAREQVDVREQALRPGVDAQVRLGEQQRARDGAVREDVERVAEHAGAAGARGVVEQRSQLVVRDEHGRVLDPGVHRVEPQARYLRTVESSQARPPGECGRVAAACRRMMSAG